MPGRARAHDPVGGDPLDAGWRATAADEVQLTIDLAPLTSAEAETMAGSFAAAEDFAAKCVTERAGGNPLFLEQLLRAAHDLVDGKLHHDRPERVVLARADLLAQSNDRRRDRGGFPCLASALRFLTLRALIDDPRYDGEALLRNALLRSAPGWAPVRACTRARRGLCVG